MFGDRIEDYGHNIHFCTLERYIQSGISFCMLGGAGNFFESWHILKFKVSLLGTIYKLVMIATTRIKNELRLLQADAIPRLARLIIQPIGIYINCYLSFFKNF